MRTHDLASDPIASEPCRIYDDLEPEDGSANPYRENAKRLLGFLWRTLNFIHEAQTHQEAIIRLWAATSALEHRATQGRSDLELAQFLQTTRANLSKLIVTYERTMGLPPKASQKSVNARRQYRQAREKQLTPITLEDQ